MFWWEAVAASSANHPCTSSGNGRHVAHTIPPGSIIDIPLGNLNNRLVEVIWDERPFSCSPTTFAPEPNASILPRRSGSPLGSGNIALFSRAEGLSSGYHRPTR
jgi:hypothetical protein